MALVVRFCKKLDQRFPVIQESEFKQHIETSFAIPLCCTSLAGMVFCATFFLQHGSYLLPREHGDRLLVIKNICFFTVCSILIMVVCAKRFISHWLCPISMEGIALVAACLAVVLFVSDMWKWLEVGWVDLHDGTIPELCQAHHISSRHVDRQWSMQTVIMALTALHFMCGGMLPIRSHVFWLLPTLGTCLLGFVFASTPCPEHLAHTLMYFFAMSGMSVWGNWKNEAYLRKEWLAQQQVEKQIDISEKQRQGFSHLLRCMSDCLVLLGPNLEIMEPCPNLAAMLMLGGQDLCGSHFGQYLASSDDYDSFVAAMGSDVSEAEPSGILPLHLKDAFRRDIQVHAYYTSFCAEGSSRYHIVGVVESQERDFPEVVAPLALGDKAGRAMQNTSWPVSAPSGSGSSRSSGTSIMRYGDLWETEKQWVVNLFQTKHFPSLENAAIVVIDSFTQGFGIIRCNSQFACLGGAFSAGLPLNAWLSKSSYHELAREVQYVVQKAILQQEDVSGEFRKLQLTPPGLNQQVYIVGQCIVACAVDPIESEGTEDGEDEENRITPDCVKSMLVLTDIRWRSAKAKPSRLAVHSRPIGNSCGGLLAL